MKGGDDRGNNEEKPPHRPLGDCGGDSLFSPFKHIQAVCLRGGGRALAFFADCPSFILPKKQV